MAGKKYRIPKVEIAIALLFFMVFLIWAVPRCKSTKKELQNTKIESAVMDSTQTENNNKSSEVADNKLVIRDSVVSTEYVSRLYITIDGLKLRTGPHLDSAVVQVLPLFEEVVFLDEVTDFKQSLSLGYEMAYEPWVKIKTKKGNIGWVYGAGVHYHKQRRSGTIE